MINKNMSILEVLQLYPKTAEVFKKHGMACVGCMGAVGETIAEGAKMHGINLEKLMYELQEKIS